MWSFVVVFKAKKVCCISVEILDAAAQAALGVHPWLLLISLGQPRSAPLSMTPSRDPTWGNSLNGVKALSCSWTEDSPQSSQLASFSDPKETVLLLSPAHGLIGPEQTRLS